MTKENKTLVILAIAMVAFVFVLRSPAYNRSAIAWDESVYLLEGDNILHGGIPYREIWDNKGAFLYFIFAMIIKITGHSIIGLRLFTVCWVSISAFFIFLTGKKLYGMTCGLLAALFYIAASSNIRLGGLTSNTEIFSILPIIIAVYSILFFKLNKWRILFCGFLCGLAFNIKSITFFDTMPILLFIIFVKTNDSKELLGTLKSIMIFCLGFLFPLIVIMAYFQWHGYLAQFLITYFVQPLRYISFKSDLLTIVGHMLKYLYFVFRSIFIVPLLGAIAVMSCFAGRYGRNKSIAFLVVWLLSVFLGLMAHHRFFDHVIIQALPALCLLGSISITQIFLEQKNGIILFFGILFVALGLMMPVSDNLISFKNMASTGNVRLNDLSFQVSEYLKKNLTGSDYIYVVNELPIIYFLTEAKIPTRYPLPFVFEKPLLYEPMLGINVVAEVKKILNSNPSYIVAQNKKSQLPLEIITIIKDYLRRNYLLDNEIGNVKIFRYKYMARLSPTK